MTRKTDQLTRVEETLRRVEETLAKLAHVVDATQDAIIPVAADVKAARSSAEAAFAACQALAAVAVAKPGGAGKTATGPGSR